MRTKLMKVLIEKYREKVISESSLKTIIQEEWARATRVVGVGKHGKFYRNDVMEGVCAALGAGIVTSEPSIEVQEQILPWQKVYSRKRLGEDKKVLVWGIPEHLAEFALRRHWKDAGVITIAKAEIQRVGKLMLGYRRRTEIRCADVRQRDILFAEMQQAFKDHLTKWRPVRGWEYNHLTKLVTSVL
jgi:hypothetical protein